MALPAALQLREIELDDTFVSGTLPAEFGRLTNMEDLDIDSSKLSGTIPGAKTDDTISLKVK